MPAWPTGSVNTTNMDSGSDNVSLARGDILEMANKTNALIAADPTANITAAAAAAATANATANAANASISGADARYGSGLFNLTAVASAAGNLTMTVTGPFKALRSLKIGDRVKVDNSVAGPDAAKKS